MHDTLTCPCDDCDTARITEKGRARSRIYIREAKRKSRGLPAPTRPCPELCENCGRLPNGAGSLHLDHDHITRKFRGWLCSECNTAIGKLGDTIAGLRRAITYLERALAS